MFSRRGHINYLQLLVRTISVERSPWFPRRPPPPPFRCCKRVTKIPTTKFVSVFSMASTTTTTTTTSTAAKPEPFARDLLLDDRPRPRTRQRRGTDGGDGRWWAIYFCRRWSVACLLTPTHLVLYFMHPRI